MRPLRLVLIAVVLLSIVLAGDEPRTPIVLAQTTDPGAKRLLPSSTLSQSDFATLPECPADGHLPVPASAVVLGRPVCKSFPTATVTDTARRDHAGKGHLSRKERRQPQPGAPSPGGTGAEPLFFYSGPFTWTDGAGGSGQNGAYAEFTVESIDNVGGYFGSYNHFVTRILNKYNNPSSYWRYDWIELGWGDRAADSRQGPFLYAYFSGFAGSSPDWKFFDQYPISPGMIVRLYTWRNNDYWNLMYRKDFGNGVLADVALCFNDYPAPCGAYLPYWRPSDYTEIMSEAYKSDETAGSLPISFAPVAYAHIEGADFRWRPFDYPGSSRTSTWASKWKAHSSSTCSKPTPSSRTASSKSTRTAIYTSSRVAATTRRIQSTLSSTATPPG